LVSYWKSEGISTTTGNSSDSLDEFENRNAIKLSKDFRHYLTAVGGMPPGSNGDTKGFHFWTLSDLKPVTVICAETGVPLPEAEHLEKHFVFADYREWSWAYAIDFSGPAEGDHPVIHVGTLRPKTVARSFSEFLDLYLRDALELYVVEAA
jgi:hypothetical protein